jgi:hypothetical protein
MSKPLDDDFNNVPVVDVVPTHGAHSQPREARGGTFATSDIALIKRALHVYKIDCLRSTESDREPHPDMAAIGNLLHRLGRIA